MARAIDAAAARALLDARLAGVEAARQAGTPVQAAGNMQTAIDTVIGSMSQSIREALLGALLAKAIDPAVDATRPYVDQGENAFSGRTLDQLVVNKFLREHEFPCTTGPFLSMFRRQARFDHTYADKVSDKAAFAAMLAAVDAVQADPTLASHLIEALLDGFVKLRDAANITLSIVPQISLEQSRNLIAQLLTQASGGRWPMVLTIGALRAFASTHALGWQIEFQGINVADKASGAAGDITVRADGRIVMAFEITERPLDEARIRATYATKIAKLAIADYAFLHGSAEPSAEAQGAASRLFALGHDILLLPCGEFLGSLLVLTGRAGRATFIAQVRDVLNDASIPTAMKVAWNKAIAGLSGV